MQALPLIMAGVQVAQGLSQASAAKSAAAFERTQYEEERQTTLLAAQQDENARRRELQSILATQDAIRGGRGTDLYSPTGKAIKRASINAAERDISASKLNYLSKARRYGLAGDQAAAAGKAGATSGYLTAAGGVLSGARAVKNRK